MLELPCELNGLEAAHHLQDLLGDVAKQVMVLHATATINCNIAVLRYRHHFEFADNSFEVVLDKGSLNALTGEPDEPQIAAERLLLEVLFHLLIRLCLC
ncbi:hypothetical protein M758_UG061700 [Ceratodon purpureus]|nr:hypothetical protein M758_UG061700 [Ceratodon purpureus]